MTIVPLTYNQNEKKKTFVAKYRYCKNNQGILFIAPMSLFSHAESFLNEISALA